VNNDKIKETIIAEVRKLDHRYESSTDAEIEKVVFRNTKTIRLRKSGWDILRKHFTSEKFELSRRLTGKELLILQKKMQYPYFLSAKNLYLFSTRDIFKIRLMGGDVSKWLS